MGYAVAAPASGSLAQKQVPEVGSARQKSPIVTRHVVCNKPRFFPATSGGVDKGSVLKGKKAQCHHDLHAEMLEFLS